MIRCSPSESRCDSWGDLRFGRGLARLPNRAQLHVQNHKQISSPAMESANKTPGCSQIAGSGGLRRPRWKGGGRWVGTARRWGDPISVVQQGPAQVGGLRRSQKYGYSRTSASKSQPPSGSRCFVTLAQAFALPKKGATSEIILPPAAREQPLYPKRLQNQYRCQNAET